MRIKLRDAKSADAAAIRGIYAPSIVDSTVSFEFEVPTPRRSPGALQRRMLNIPGW